MFAPVEVFDQISAAAAAAAALCGGWRGWSGGAGSHIWHQACHCGRQYRFHLLYSLDAVQHRSPPRSPFPHLLSARLSPENTVTEQSRSRSDQVLLDRFCALPCELRLSFLNLPTYLPTNVNSYLPGCLAGWLAGCLPACLPACVPIYHLATRPENMMSVFLSPFGLLCPLPVRSLSLRYGLHP